MAESASVCVSLSVSMCVRKRKRNLFILVVYVNKPCRPILVYYEHAISLSAVPWPSSFFVPTVLFPCTLHYLPPILHHCDPPASLPHNSFCASCPPSLPPPQAPEAGASLGEVWPTTGHWLWVIKVV